MANVSHELKTPIGALGLLAETLVAEPDAEVAQRLAGRIHNEAFRVSRIIDDLLDLSRDRVRGGAASANRSWSTWSWPTPSSGCGPRPTSGGSRSSCTSPPRPIAVVGERRQLVSAMHALLENAITYSLRRLQGGR